MYHEKQCRELCALHAINNLLQAPVFQQRHLDDICVQLAASSGDSWIFNRHKSPLGTGNYDVNVLLAALQQRHLRVDWFDRRRAVSTIDCAAVLGFIVNRPSRVSFGAFSVPVWRRHWVAIRAITSSSSSAFYDLDSKFAEPKLIGDVSALLSYLEEQLVNESVQLLVVRADTPPATTDHKS